MMPSSLPSSARGLPRPGDVVAGKYRIEATIGTGGMGIVMAAVDTTLGRPVAIKLLSPERAARDGAGARFLREARTAASIQSEHVVRVFEVATLPDGVSYIAMELLKGVELGDLVASRGGLPIDEAVDHVLEACAALAEAHRLGVVHRDLKPQNLFVTQRPDGTPCVKILDFGISKAQSADVQSLTATDTVMGTPLYMSPEQVRSLKNVDHRTDIWALGAILFELLTASPVFDAPTASALCAMIAMDPPTPLRMRRPAAPPALEAVIYRCMNKDPAGRFRDVVELAEALVPFASERGRRAAMLAVRIARSEASFAPTDAQLIRGPQSMATAPTVDSGSVRTTGAPFPLVQHPVSPMPSGQPPMGPSGFPVAPIVSAPPPGSLPPNDTQRSWQEPSAQTAKSGGSAVVFAMAGAVVGLLFLGGGGYVAYTKLTPHPTAPVASNVEPAPPPSMSPSNVAPGMTTPVPSASSAPSPSAAPSASASAAKPTVPPKGAKDAGAPAAPSSAPKNDSLEAEKRIAQGRCDHMKFLLSTNDRKTNANANQVKTLTCLPASTQNGINCERAVCRSACEILDDKSCIRQLDFAERNWPAKF
ncbi:serine/threonine protein kinase [Labilithrix luteola]|uniref:Serine/threonine protein kinase n=1 Tax=Labilithrix luteola TaxID=1391654 RepID=A0A0K1PX10_9BACT|nr:serine/threonine-protein kinase [Labilithrix luteola]AKU98063.1 serine/threonine protein kinase [Labilithrix luteola]